MQIYVIKRGDTLFNIARVFNTTVASIQEANKIPNPENLVVGQTLVIPIDGRYYRVQQGDTLWSIAQRFGINYRELANINDIPLNSPLRINTRLYIPQRPKTRAEINAYLQTTGEEVTPALLETSREVSPFLTYLAPFSYEVNRDGSLTEIPIEGLASIADKYNTSLMMVVTNIEDGKFSGELAREILQNPSVQQTLLDNIVTKTRETGIFTDVHFDFEFIPGELQQAYTDFLRKATERMRAEGLLVSAALAPKTSAEQTGQWYEAHNYNAIGNVVDFVVIMTYEWGYSGGPPLAVSPIIPVERVLRYALTEMPAYKIMMGQNLYGYDWTLPFVRGESFAKAISPQQAIETAAENNAAISYDLESQAPFFSYIDREGKRHIVWFEDARSIQAKIMLVKELGIRGISYWRLAFDFPQNWLLVDDNFIVVKK